MRRFDKNKNIAKANLIVEQRYLESKGLVNESWRSEYLVNVIGKEMQEKGIERHSEEWVARMKPLSALDDEIDKIYRTFTGYDAGQVNNTDRFKAQLKGELQRLVNGGKKLNIEPNDVKDAISGVLYSKFFDSGSNSFSRSYNSSKVAPLLSVVKNVLEELQFSDETMGLIGRIDKYLNVNK